MDETTMVLLTGLLGTALGVVLIGGAMVGAFLVGRSRGRREAVEELSGRSTDPVRLAALESNQRALREEIASLSARLGSGQPVNRQ